MLNQIRFLNALRQLLCLTLLYGTQVFAAEPAALQSDLFPCPLLGPAKLLQRLQRRDATLENRILKVEERSIERVDARAAQAKSRFIGMKYGQNNVEYPDPATLPEAYDQPHRVLYELIMRDNDVSMKVMRDLEKQLKPGYGTRPNRGSIWSTVGESARWSNPTWNHIHITEDTGANRLRPNSFQWCTGHGFAKWMSKIESITPKDDRIIIKGIARVFNLSGCSMELEIDQDLIVRRAVISTPVINGGSNEYRVTTQGAVQPTDTPALAEQGNLVRVLMPAGRPEHEYIKHDIAFVSLSEPLSDEAYTEVTRIQMKPDTTISDFQNPVPRKASTLQNTYPSVTR